MEVYEAIKNGIGSEMTEAQVWTLVALAQTKYFDGGETIVRRFEKSSDLIIILEGSARIDGIHGDTIVEVSAGSILGEIALLDEQPRSATVRSVGGTRVAIIPAGKLTALMSESTHFEAALTRHICRMLCLRLRHANARFDRPG